MKTTRPDPSDWPLIRQIVVFDGDCGMCNQFVGWAIRWLRQPDTGFLPSQSENGQRWLAANHREPEPTTLLLVRPDGIYERSDAVLELCAGMRAPVRWLHGLRWIPRSVRNLLYRAVARVRRALPFRKQICQLDGDRQRLLLDNSNANWPQWWRNP